MSTAHRKHQRKRLGKLRALALALAGIFVLVAAVAQLIVAPTIQRKLQETVAAHLDASLTIGAITYRPPFTVRLYDVHLLAHPKRPGGGTELLSARRIDLSLAKLPLGQGPVLIERLGIDGLTLHAIRRSDGSYHGLDISRGQHQAIPLPQKMKLSDVLRLRHFTLKDGTIIYEDQAKPQAAPAEWHGISSDMALALQSASLYGFQLDASDEPIARAHVDGTIDVDSLLLEIKKLTASVQAPGAQSAPGPDPLPPELRDQLRRYCVKGTITLTTVADVPLNNPAQASLSADLGVNGGGAIVPVSGEALDDLVLSIHLQHDAASTSSQPIRFRLNQFRAVSAGAILQLHAASGFFEPASGRWSIAGISGALDAPAANHGPWAFTGHADFHADVSHDPQSDQTLLAGAVNVIGINVSPPSLAAPVEGLTGTIHFAGNDSNDRRMIFQNFVARYGGDTVALDHAELALPQFLDHMPDRIVVNDIQSRLDLAGDAPECPGDLGPILHTFQPSGNFVVTGTAAMQHVIRDDGPGYSPEWDLDISTTNGNLALLDGRLPVTELSARMLATKQAINIPQLQGKMLGGSMDLVATARVVEPIAYQGELNERGADVQQFARVFDIKSPDGKAPSGSATLKFNFLSHAPSSPPNATSAAASQPSSESDEWLALLAGDGRLQIDNGNLWALPALQSLSRHTRVARQALTAGEAAAIFSVGNRVIDFKHLAVYSPALGLQGSGTESFDGMLNLDIIAAPLGDWKEKLKKTDIPILSSVIATAAGSIEKLVASATSELLYRFHITGTRDNPQIETVPAPFITDSAANLFAKMLHHDDNAKLIDSVGEK